MDIIKEISEHWRDVEASGVEPQWSDVYSDFLAAAEALSIDG